MGLSIGGLGSGLDTQGIISQLMQAEGIPQSTLRGQLSSNSVKVGAWTSLGTIVASLKTTADTVRTPAGLVATAATTNSPGQVTVSSATTAAAGSLTFRVARLASAQQLTTGSTGSPTTVIGRASTVITAGHDQVGATSVTTGDAAVTGRHTVVVTGSGADVAVTADGLPATLTTSDTGDTSLLLADGTTVRFAGAPRAGTLSIGIAVTASDTSTMADMATALSVAGGPARAALVDSGSGTDPYRLVLSSTTTGAAGALRVSSTVPGLGTTTELRQAQDAQVVLGEGAGALTISRSSNTLTDLMPGVSITLTKADPATDVTVTVTRDDDTVAKRVKSLVDSLNATLGWIKTNSAYNVSTSKGGPMVGDAGVRNLASQLTDAMQMQGPGPLKSLGQVGIALQRDGTYTFDDAALRSALTKDPDAVAGLVSTVAGAVDTVATAANATNGVVDIGKRGVAANGTDLQTRIDAWDQKLKDIQTRYERTFSALDVAMSRMNSQMASLSQQLKSLPTR